MTLRIEENGDVLTATIDRPEALNAIDFETMDELDAVVTRLEVESWRVFVLTGAGSKSFVSGGDLKRFAALETEDEAREMATRMSAILRRIEELPCWTIAALNAAAYGGGCETALAFDFRLASSRAKLGFTQVRFHVTPGWGGLTRLVELVGRPQAIAWLSQGAVLGADEAFANGLVHGVSHDLEGATYALASRLARQDREFIAALKGGALAASRLGRDEAMAAELEPFCQLWAGDEHQRRVQQFLKRPDDA